MSETCRSSADTSSGSAFCACSSRSSITRCCALISSTTSAMTGPPGVIGAGAPPIPRDQVRQTSGRGERRGVRARLVLPVAGPPEQVALRVGDTDRHELPEVGGVLHALRAQRQVHVL